LVSPLLFWLFCFHRIFLEEYTDDRTFIIDVDMDMSFFCFSSGGVLALSSSSSLFFNLAFLETFLIDRLIDPAIN